MNFRCTFCGCTADVQLTKLTGEKVSVCRSCVPKGTPLKWAKDSGGEPIRGGLGNGNGSGKYRHITRRGFSLL